MSQTHITHDTNATRADGDLLLACGVVAGPFFLVVALAQAFTRAGFDPLRHPISLLSLGELGWIQITDFIVTGLLVLGFAAALRRVLRPGGAPAALIAGYGAGTILAGLCTPDPSLGFPPGAPTGAPPTQSWHSMAHGVGFGVSFLALTIACLVFRRRYIQLGRRAWARFCMVTAVLAPAAAITGLAVLSVAGIAFLVAGAAGSAWITANALHLSATAPKPSVR